MSLNLLQPLGPVQACNGIALPFIFNEKLRLLCTCDEAGHDSDRETRPIGHESLIIGTQDDHITLQYKKRIWRIWGGGGEYGRNRYAELYCQPLCALRKTNTIAAIFDIILIVLHDKLYNKTNEMHFLESMVVATSPHVCTIHTINCMYSRIASWRWLACLFETCRWCYQNKITESASRWFYYTIAARVYVHVKQWYEVNK